MISLLNSDRMWFPSLTVIEYTEHCRYFQFICHRNSVQNYSTVDFCILKKPLMFNNGFYLWSRYLGKWYPITPTNLEANCVLGYPGPLSPPHHAPTHPPTTLGRTVNNATQLNTMCHMCSTCTYTRTYTRTYTNCSCQCWRTIYLTGVCLTKPNF